MFSLPSLSPTILVEHSFTQSEAPRVVEEFVCAACHSDLEVMEIPNEGRVLIVCPEHGTVTVVGRVTRNTVSIDLEKAYRRFQEVIRNLPEYWGKYIKIGFEYDKAGRIARDYVCKTCGGYLLLEAMYDEQGKFDREHVNLVCSACHKNINESGYTKKETKYVTDRRINGHA